MSEVQAGVLVRVATEADADALAAFGARTFAATYEADNDPAQTAAHVARTFGPGRQAAELADPERVMLVAEVEGQLAGYALVHLGAAPPVDGVPGQPGELERFYVDRPWHGRGLADALMDAALEQAAQRGVEALWLLVWEKNARAIGFYQRRGFREQGRATFMYGDEAQTDLCLVRTVRERRGLTGAAPARVARPALTVRLQRGRDGRDLLACVRADGTTSWLRRPAGIPRRDLALLALEGALGLPGVFAAVATGGELLELLRPEQATRPDALGWALRLAAVLDAEAIAPVKAGADVLRTAANGGHPQPDGVDDASVGAAREAVAHLAEAWRRVGADQALEMTLAPGVPHGLGAPRLRPGSPTR